MSNWESQRDFDADKRLAKEEAFTDMLEALEAVGEALGGFGGVGPHEAFVFSEQTAPVVNAAFAKALAAIKKARGPA
jgi:hypothetical protein